MNSRNISQGLWYKTNTLPGLEDAPCSQIYPKMFNLFHLLKTRKSSDNQKCQDWIQVTMQQSAIISLATEAK